MKTCATGEHIKDATITVRKAGKGQQEFLIIKMSDVIVTSVAESGRATPRPRPRTSAAVPAAPPTSPGGAAGSRR